MSFENSHMLERAVVAARLGKKRAMKIYTKQGDAGLTTLGAGSGRIEKCDARVCALGEIDELNSHLGYLLSTWAEHGPAPPPLLRDRTPDVLFDLGAALANPRRVAALTGFLDGQVVEMETAIDAMTSSLPCLTNFILPGGQSTDATAAYVHVVRAVCRRAERAVSNKCFDEHGSVRRYLNRMSDFLFTLARWRAHGTGTLERLYTPNSCSL